MDNIFKVLGKKHIIHPVKRSFKYRNEMKGVPQPKGKWPLMEATLQERMKSTRQDKYAISIKEHFLP